MSSTQEYVENLMPRKPHPFQWIVESLESDPTFVDRSMFGCRATYYYGLLVLVCSAQDEPWNGIMVPVEREHHASVLADFSVLQPHPVLGKWLYLSQTHPEFEAVSLRVVERIILRDPRFGVEPKPKKRRTQKSS